MFEGTSGAADLGGGTAGSRCAAAETIGMASPGFETSRIRDAETGVDLMRMEKGLDTGPLMLRLTTPITDADTGGTLHDRLSALGAEVLGDGLKLLRAGMVPVSLRSEGAADVIKLRLPEDLDSNQRLFLRMRTE